MTTLNSRPGSRNCLRVPFKRAILILCLLVFANVVQAQQTNLEPDSWYLFSLPGNTDQTVDELFADDFNGQSVGTSWSIIVFDAQAQHYRPVMGTETLSAGQGFWMTQVGEAAVSVQLPQALASPATTQSAACAVAAGCIATSLPMGSGEKWSLIGIPFTESVSISALRIQTINGACQSGCSLTDAVASGMTSGLLHAYDTVSGQYVDVTTGDNMQPGTGYWFPSLLGDSTGAATLLIPGSGVGEPASVFAKAATLGRGMNLGNALEAPSEGLWGLVLEDYFFDRIADAGFDSVRVPIRWSAHASESAPYAIDPDFLARIDWVVAQSLRVGLTVVLNVHHFEALMASPTSQSVRYLALWDQIAQRYSGQPDSVFFELLNEPTDRFNEEPELWNSLLADAINVIRQSNPDRALMVGPVGWNAINRLSDLQLPDDDQLIATVHFYSPFAFTHQGATWVNPVPPIGLAFDPAIRAIGGAFQDWSWDTSWTAVDSGVLISYQRQYAGFNLRKRVDGQLRELSVSINGAAQLSVACGQGGSFSEVAQINQSAMATREHVIDLSTCDPVTETVTLQNQTPSSASFTLVQGEVCTVSRCHPMFETAGEALAAELQVAADWGANNNRPVYVGEFGAFGAGDMASRAAWTRTVQDAVRQQGMTSAYWEFGAGFGAFNLSEDRWNVSLLDALFGR